MATKTGFQIPTTLKLSALRALATKCGLQTTGTKPVLINRLQHEITSNAVLSQRSQTRILSIDMGIRNLAYCVLDVPVSTSKLTHHAEKDSRILPKRSLPVLQAWHRLAVSTAPKENSTSSDSPVAKEAFDPATLSSIAYNLLRQRLLLHNPAIILIERQRFRSMGSKHILEWTVRVNMLESILYATLHTLRSEGLWEGKVIAITPGKVGPFWVGNESEDEAEEEIGSVRTRKVRKSQVAKVKNKGKKIDLVRSWCQSGDVVTWGNAEVAEMVRKYGEKWERKPGGVKGPRVKPTEKEGQEEKMGKLDDLADCLLQGMAWVEWDNNKKVALEAGAEALLDPE